MIDYKSTIQEAVNSLSAKTAVSVLNDASKGLLRLDRDTELKLSYIRLTSLSVDQIKELMLKSVLVAYQLPDYSLAEKVASTCEQFFDELLEIQLYRNIIPILENNEEVFGLSTILTNGTQVPATIGNWLKDYSIAEQHDPLYQMKYINSSPNAKQLSENDRKVLLDIIKLYDKAVSMVNMFDSIQLPEEGKFLPENYDLSIYFPDMEEDTGSLSVGVPASEGDIAPPDNKNEDRVASDFKIPLAKELDLKTMPKRGLVFDQKTNVDLSRAADENRESEIQAKLEELKKRKGP